jgi:plasmid stability protein
MPHALHAIRYHPDVPNVQIRDVPDDVHRRLKAEAAEAGQSLNEFLLARLTEMARLPTWTEFSKRVARREPYTGPSAAALIREARDQR